MSKQLRQMGHLDRFRDIYFDILNEINTFDMI